MSLTFLSMNEIIFLTIITSINMKVYCFGNEFVKDDALAKEIVNDISLPNVQFIKTDRPEVILEEKDKIVILDVVKGIKELTIITDIDSLKDRNIVSLHDFDLGFFLKLMKTAGTIKDVHIIGLPISGDKQLLTEQVKEHLEVML